MAARQDPLRNFRYRLEIDQIQQAGFAEVAIGDLSNEPIEYREGDDGHDRPQAQRADQVRQRHAQVGRHRLRRTSPTGTSWSSTAPPARRRSAQRRDPPQDEAGQDKAAWELTKAWPCKYDPTDLNGKGNEVAIDTLELCNEGIKRIQ